LQNAALFTIFTGYNPPLLYEAAWSVRSRHEGVNDDRLYISVELAL